MSKPIISVGGKIIFGDPDKNWNEEEWKQKYFSTLVYLLYHFLSVNKCSGSVLDINLSEKKYKSATSNTVIYDNDFDHPLILQSTDNFRAELSTKIKKLQNTKTINKEQFIAEIKFLIYKIKNWGESKLAICPFPTSKVCTINLSKDARENSEERINNIITYCKDELGGIEIQTNVIKVVEAEKENKEDKKDKKSSKKSKKKKSSKKSKKKKKKNVVTKEHVNFNMDSSDSSSSDDENAFDYIEAMKMNLKL